ncbi:MAG TPA: class I SAM-dependent methyltransferase [Mycobacteriales bacterium]|nr:class I SAM-dependent methyltransferase [Mycobacteriales bacterium]
MILIQLFGTAAPWVAAAVLMFMVIIVAVAVRQGREISVWPPRIGSRPADATRVPGWVPTGLPGPGRPPERADREYGVDRARRFYQEIASSYDLRNSGNIASTHLATVAQLQAIRDQRHTLRVLDLGGGTGKLIAVHFFNDAHVSWTYVDFSPAMAAQFQQNLSGYPLGENSEIIVEDLARAVSKIRPESYDVVLLSLVLSSMPELPNLTAIARVLRPDGLLIITDINPGYTYAKPLYKVSVDKSLVALRTAPVDPFEVIRRAQAAGLRTTGQRTIGTGSVYYSFMMVFTPVAGRVADGKRDGRSLVQS